MNIEEGLDFILEHFEEPKFPRTISTKATKNAQVMVYSREEALHYFQKANYEDCRISAFSQHEIVQVIPNLIFIDLDDITVIGETLYNFGKFRAKPLVIATGNGFAVILPIKMASWKNTTQHGKTGEELAKLFLLFASRFFSNKKSDSGNHPSLKSCLIRIPASINSKNGKKVEIQMFWDKKRIDVEALPFQHYVNEIIRKENRWKTRTKNLSSKDIPYIEKLLKRNLKDGRNRACDLIILPYLLNVKKMSIDETIELVYNYFSGHIPKQEIQYKAKRVLEKEIPPYRLANMKDSDPELYELVVESTLVEMSNR